MICLTRRYGFPAAHVLRSDELGEAENENIFGKCANPNWHGHNYEVFVTVRGEIDEATGYFINFSDLKAIIKDKVEEPLDHKNLNLDVPWMQGKQTSVENLVIAIWEQLEPIMRRCTAYHA